MGWITLSLRRNELQTSIQQLQYNLLEINRQRRELSRLANAIGDGQITPAEIGSLGSSVFGDALDFMGFSNDAAMEAASLQTDYYAQAYGSVTQDQYYNNPNLAAQATLYYDEAGNLNTQAMYNEFYEQALKDYAATVVMPQLNELEQELMNEQTEIETEIESQEAELQVVKENISESIQNSTIQL